MRTIIIALLKILLICLIAWGIHRVLGKMQYPDLVQNAFPFILGTPLVAYWLRGEVFALFALLESSSRYQALHGRHYYFQDQEVRIVFDGENNPHFAEIDVCAVLGIKDSDEPFRHCSAAEYGFSDDGKLKCVSPSALLRTIAASRHPDALRFKLWVERDILATLAKRKDWRLPMT